MAEDIEVRRLGSVDFDTILASDAFDHAADEDQTRAFLDSPDTVIIGALESGAMIGFASATILRHPDKLPMLFVNEVGVNEPWQNQGIGARLMTALIDWARARGCEGIWLATEEDNAPARALYRKLDARETTGVVVFDWDGALDR
ncbi:MAG: GNAT family N-acetyltransferase [Pseudomonadota bacterium]|nr:GNAT family N-acetyltransferase [Pseudomonadota bacterium]